MRDSIVAERNRFRRAHIEASFSSIFAAEPLVEEPQEVCPLPSVEPQNVQQLELELEAALEEIFSEP